MAGSMLDRKKEWERRVGEHKKYIQQKKQGQLGQPDEWAEQYGLTEFGPGGQYAPENIMALLEPILQRGQVPQTGAPSLSELQRYGRGAMDIAGRAGSLQAGHAATGLGGLNPAARAAAMSQISQAAGANVGQAGMQGMMAGGDWLQRASLANQQAQMQELLQSRGMGGSLLGQSMGATAQVGLGRLGQMGGWQLGLQQLWEQMSARMAQQKAAEQQGFWNTLGGLGGAVGTIGGMFMGGPAGAAAGGQLMGSPQTTGFSQTPQMPGYPQGTTGQPVKPHYPKFQY